MKAMDVRKEVLDYILGDLQTTVMRLGINAQLSYKVDKDYRGAEYLAIESTKFQTSPVIFNELWIDGTVSVLDLDDNGFSVYIRLHHNWRSFKGGTNGTELGNVRYYVEKDLPEKFGEDGVRFYVRKVESIEV